MKKVKILSEKEIWAEIDYENGNTGSILVFPSDKVKEFIADISNDIEDAQEDYGNLDWISKEQALKIIKRRAGDLK